MLRVPLLLASVGLAWNLMLWSVPALVLAAGIPHALDPRAPGLGARLGGIEQSAGSQPSLPDALVRLIGAEAEALQVAADGLQQPPPPTLARQADQAGADVLSAVRGYIVAAATVLDHAANR
jgi:hypothetical protein